MRGGTQPSNIRINGAGAIKILNFRAADALDQATQASDSAERACRNVYSAACGL
jgi:hypothetical protein